MLEEVKEQVIDEKNKKPKKKVTINLHPIEHKTHRKHISLQEDEPEANYVEPEEEDADDGPPRPLEDALKRHQLLIANEHYTMMREFVMAFTLIPFIFCGYPFVENGWIAWVVFCNGFVTHVSCAYAMRCTNFLRIWDTIVNVSLCVVVNALTHWQPQTAFFTVYTFFCWIFNRYRLSGLGVIGMLKDWQKSTICVNSDIVAHSRKQTQYAVIHVLCVQWGLLWLLYVYEYNFF